MASRLVWIGAILGLLPSVAVAQETQRVEGIVLDAADRSAISNAVVRLLDVEGELVVSGLSDARGGFSLTAPSAGGYTVEAVRVGYQPATLRISLEPGETLRIELELESDPIPLDAIVVTGDRSDRPPRCTPQILYGRVVSDAAGDTDEMIAGAVIELVGAEGKPLATARTDAAGRFTFGTPGPGMYRLRGSAEGHVPADGGEFPILPGDTVEVRFRLSRDEAVAAPMEVTASARPWNDRYKLGAGRAFYDRMADCQNSPDGSRYAVFIDREVIAEYDGWRTNEMIDWEARVVFGLSPGGAIILFGGCRPGLFVDGVRSFMSLRDFSPDELEAVEIHRWPRVPRRFWITGLSPCGVVALWTRRTPAADDDAGDAEAGPVRYLLGGGAVLGILYLLFH